MAVMLGPPPAAPVQQQRGPFSMAAGQQQQAPPPQAQPGGPGGQDSGSPSQPLEGQLIMVTIQMKHMLQMEPALGPWVNDAISRLQSGVRTILAQQRQSSGGSMPLESATPSSEPGAGLPF